MPLDLASELARRQRETDALLAQSRDPALNANRAELGGYRGQFFGNTVSPLVGEYTRNAGLSPTGVPSGRIQGMLGAEAERAYGRRRYAGLQDILNKTYSLQQNRNQQATSNAQDAVDFSRLSGSQARQNLFQADMAESDWQAGYRQQDMADKYAQEGLMLQSQFTPQMDYSGALARSLFGLGGSALAAYYLAGKTPAQTQVPLSTDPNSLSYQMIHGLPQGPTLGEQSMYSRMALGGNMPASNYLSGSQFGANPYRGSLREQSMFSGR